MKMVQFVTALAVMASAGMLGSKAEAQTAAPVVARNVVLVHGAWADGSSWAAVIPYLQAAGLKVTAVQNPLTSLAESVAATRRALALQDGPTVLVAHSWGGTVISETGTDPKVSALVYVAARGPDADEDFVALSGKFPTGAVRAGVGHLKPVVVDAVHKRALLHTYRPQIRKPAVLRQVDSPLLDQRHRSARLQSPDQ